MKVAILQQTLVKFNASGFEVTLGLKITFVISLVLLSTTIFFPVVNSCICILCRLHALKDESFLRTTLQRQAARLQQAAVVYAVRTWLGSLTTAVM